MRTRIKESILFCLDNPQSLISESYRGLRANIQYISSLQNIKTLLVTSAIPREGKSTTVSNLAVSLSLDRKKVLLIDGDLRKPSIHHIFRISNTYGLINVLTGEQDFDEVIQHVSDYLDVIPCSPIPTNPTEHLSSENMLRILEKGKNSYDFILIDSNPLLAVSDGIILSKMVDGVVFVAMSGKVKQEEIQKAKSLLDQVGANLIGSVLNRKTMKSNKYYYDYL